MSDVTCDLCQEPWDTYHLQHDAPHDALSEVPHVNSDKAMTDGWYAKHDKPRLDTIIPGTGTTWREAFFNAGWEFGRVVTDVRRCPCCPVAEGKDNDTDPGYGPLRDELAALLGDDEDGLAAALEDLG